MNDREHLKSRNLDSFRRRMPALHRQLAGFAAASKVAFGEDGEADVDFEGHRFYGGRARAYAARRLEEFWKAPNHFLLPPPEMRPDEHAIRFKNGILRRAVDEGIEFHERPVSSQSYFLVVFGVGLGYHFDELVEKTDCQTLIVADANPEFLHHSLEVYDWSALFESFLESGRTIHFLFEELPENMWNTLKFLVRTTNPCAFDGLKFFVHYDIPVFSGTIALMIKEAGLVVSGIGYMFDETLMLKNAHWNLFSGESRVYYRPQERVIGVPVFIVGSGPSLDKDLPFIKDNAERAVIISCGSALRPLAVNGVVPDFHVEVENIYVLPLISSAAKEHDISKVCLVSTSTSEIGVSDYFDNIVYFFRSSLSPYPLYCDSDKYCLKNTHPTVLIAGLSFAQEIGFRDFYFFGVDLAVKDVDSHHAKDSHVYTDESLPNPHVYDIAVQANFGGKCHTYHDFLWTLSCLANVIKEFRSGHGYYNCSDGALIEGAQPRLASSLSFSEVEGGKGKVVEKIIGEFPIYSKEMFEKAWNEEKIVHGINGFISEFQGLLDGVSTFRDKSYLKPLMSFLPAIIDSDRIGTKPVEDAVMVMFRGTLHMMLMCIEYYLNRIADPDMARRFEKIARQEIAERLEQLRLIAIGELSGLNERVKKGEPPVAASAPKDIVGSAGEEPKIQFRPVPGAPPAARRPADISRNAPCPCGSGKKYKHCHGSGG